MSEAYKVNKEFVDHKVYKGLQETLTFYLTQTTTSLRTGLRSPLEVIPITLRVCPQTKTPMVSLTFFKVPQVFKDRLAREAKERGRSPEKGKRAKRSREQLQRQAP